MDKDGPFGITKHKALLMKPVVVVEPGRVVLTGDFDASNRAQADIAFAEAAQACGDSLLIDLTGVTFCSAAFLSALSLIHESCALRQIDVQVAPSGIVRRALKITALDEVLTLADV